MRKLQPRCSIMVEAGSKNFYMLTACLFLWRKSFITSKKNIMKGVNPILKTRKQRVFRLQFFFGILILINITVC